MSLDTLDALLWGSDKKDTEPDHSDESSLALSCWLDGEKRWVSFAEWRWLAIERIFAESRRRRGLPPERDWALKKQLEFIRRENV